MKVQSDRPHGSPSPVRALIGTAVAERLAANPNMRPAKTSAAQMFVHPDFLSAEECATLMRLIDAGSRPSTLLTRSRDPNFRTSYSCDLDRWSPEVQPVDERMADLLGIEPRYGETMQGQRYAPGQQFRAHHDYFHEYESYWPAMEEQGGQRTWTSMIFLNAVEQGGATWFPQAGVRFPPRPGMLLTWNNCNPDGTPNKATLHEGLAVVAGTKYIVTKWFRERPWIKF